MKSVMYWTSVSMSILRDILLLSEKNCNFLQYTFLLCLSSSLQDFFLNRRKKQNAIAQSNRIINIAVTAFDRAQVVTCPSSCWLIINAGKIMLHWLHREKSRIKRTSIIHANRLVQTSHNKAFLWQEINCLQKQTRSQKTSWVQYNPEH